MIVTNINYVPGKEIIEHYGLVTGSTVRSKHFGRDFFASLKNIVGGELKGYTELLNESRKEAISRLVAQAESLGANAVLNVRFSTTSVASGAAELYVYGTAVRTNWKTMSDLIIFLTLVIIGFSVGTFNERRHLTSLRRREAKSLDLPTISSDELDPTRLVQECTLVVGSVVIATDYFKVVAASIANFFGRRVSAYETLLDRARRESLLRMKDQAEGYDIIIHTRLESCSIGGEAAGRNSAKSVECFAYGTAVRYAPVEG